MTLVSLSIVGFGIMGERLLRAALEDPDPAIEIAGVWDPSEHAMRRLAETLPQVPRLNDATAALAADCLYIASPPSYHLLYARQALSAQRAFFCEKPLAVDQEEARDFVAECETRGARAGVNFPFASSPAVEQLAKWLSAGEVGALRRASIEVAFAAWPRPWQMDAAAWLDGRSEGGFTREVVSHFLFLAGRFLGRLALDEASTVYPNKGQSERAIDAHLRAGALDLQIRGRVGDTEAADHNIFMLEGEHGALRLRDWSIAEISADGKIWSEAADAMVNERMRPLVLRRQLSKVAAMTRGLPNDLATLREAFEVQEIVEAILRA